MEQEHWEEAVVVESLPAVLELAHPPAPRAEAPGTLASVASLLLEEEPLDRLTAGLVQVVGWL